MVKSNTNTEHPMPTTIENLTIGQAFRFGPVLGGGFPATVQSITVRGDLVRLKWHNGHRGFSRVFPKGAPCEVP
jgi:hypothetical protein